MKTINAKIKELLQVSAVNLFGDKDFSRKFDAKNGKAGRTHG